jgi:hypothetical protein
VILLVTFVFTFIYCIYIYIIADTNPLLHVDKGKGKVVPVLLTDHRAMKACGGVEV